MAVFAPLPQLSDEDDDDAVGFPPTHGQSSNGERAWHGDSCRTKQRQPPPPTSPHSSYWHRWRCVCSGVCVCVCVGTWCSYTFPRSQWATGQAHTWLVYITGSVSSQRNYSTLSCRSVRIQCRYSEGAGVVFQKLVDFCRSFVVSS